MLAFGALLASGALTRKQAPTSAPGTSPAADPQAGGLLGGSGWVPPRSSSRAVKATWLNHGSPAAKSADLAGSTCLLAGLSLIKTLAEKTGLSEQDVTAQLSKILPAFVDKLTPQGRVPTHDDISRFLAVPDLTAVIGAQLNSS